MKSLFLIAITGFFCTFLQAQNDSSAKALPIVVGFYNLENLFDTINNPTKDDEEFLPNALKKYNSEKYFDKIGRLADVISQIGLNYNPDGLALMGCAEIENDTVLTDLVLHDKLAGRGYQFVQFGSPDNRGIDVGLIYNPLYFKVLFKESVHVELPSHYPTRDILYVKGLLYGDTVHVLVNHWPSRSGGNNSFDANIKEGASRNANNGRTATVSTGAANDAGLGGSNNNNRKYMEDAGSTSGYRDALVTDGEEATRALRLSASKVCRGVIDSILGQNIASNIIIMGDLNDDPTNASVVNGIKAKLDIKKVADGDIYNPWGEILKQGYGTLAFGGKWNLFDQIMFSSGLLVQSSDLFLYKTHIYYNGMLINKDGPYKGYPKRTWQGDEYNFGYSDHLPVYSVLLKRL